MGLLPLLGIMIMNFFGRAGQSSEEVFAFIPAKYKFKGIAHNNEIKNLCQLLHYV